MRTGILLLALLPSLPLAAAPDLIVYNAKVASFNQQGVTAFAVKEGRFTELSSSAQNLLSQKDSATQLIDAGGRLVIPGLNDSHLHVVRGGRFYNLETRWEGINSLKQALSLVAQQAKRTPKGHWVRVVGGWTPEQFAEKRLPTLAELDQAAPNTPVFILHLYSGAILNSAGLAALGITSQSQAPKGSYYEKDAKGQLTGQLVADPNPQLLYQSIAALPGLSPEQQLNSSLQFFQALLGYGVTSVVDAGGGGHQFPQQYQASTRLAVEGKLPVRIANYLFPQQPGDELNQFARWMANYQQDQNLDARHPRGYTIAGGGELLAWSASDYENFRSPRPELKPGFELELQNIVRMHLLMRWPFRIHATYDETIDKMLDVLEKINKDQPLNKVRWAFDHAETVSDRNLERIQRLGGGIAVQARLAFAGEDFLARYGKTKTQTTAPVKKMLELGIPVGLGTDGTRVASFNPWVTYYWLVSGKTLGGTQLTAEEQRLDRLTALKLFTLGSAWFSGDEQQKGAIAPGMLADFSILNQDIFQVEEQQLLQTRSELTVVDGRTEYASKAFPAFAKPRLKAEPLWSPVNFVPSE
ncbi:amidohydrolase [Rheinheimera sp.]|uniref:amidohydrolase n=1 Tax=Rheinheimera sp. TaxID=1869214 RepID=UPI00307D60E6